MKKLVLLAFGVVSVGCGTAVREVPSTSPQASTPEGLPAEADVTVEQRSAFLAGEGMLWRDAPNRIWVEACPRGEPCTSMGNVIDAAGHGASVAFHADRFSTGSQAGEAWLSSVHGALRDANIPTFEQAPARPTEAAFQVIACSPDGCRSVTDDLNAPVNTTAQLILPYLRDTLRQLSFDPELPPPDAHDEARRRRAEALNNARANPQRVQEAGSDGSMTVVATNFQVLIETGEGDDALGGLGPVIIASPISLNVQLPDFQSQRPNLFNQTAAATQVTALVEGVLPSAQVRTFWPPAAGHRRFHIVRDTNELWVIDVPVCGPVPAPLRTFAEAGSHAVAVVREAMHLPPEVCPR